MSSNVNPVDSGVDNALVNRIVDLEKQLQALKSNVQPIDASSIKVQSQQLNFGFASTAAGATATAGAAFAFTTPPPLTIWEYDFALYVDTVDEAHRVGGTGSPAGLAFKQVLSYFPIIQPDNTRFLYVQIRNIDTVAHTYTVIVTALLPVSR